MKGGADKEEAEAQIGDHFYGSWSNIFHLLLVLCWLFARQEQRAKTGARRCIAGASTDAVCNVAHALAITKGCGGHRGASSVRDDWRDGQHLARGGKTKEGRRRLLPGFR